MDISAMTVKELRDRTGAGVMACKKALVEAKGDLDKAVQLLRQRGLAGTEKMANRVASQGLVESYIHAGGRIGAMVEVNCETDFVARTQDFKALAHDLAMQVAATGPRFIDPEEVPPEGNEDHKEICLLSQPFIRNPDITVQQLIAEVAAKMGEKVKVRRFARFELGS